MCESRVKINLYVNGKKVETEVEPRLLLADFLRDYLVLKGTHLGCEHGVCGACTILLNGESVRSCLMFAVQCDGHSITTVEGLAKQDKLHALQQIFLDNDSLQCGFCTPGMLMTILGYFSKFKGKITEDKARKVISGNICRCTGYEPIIKAIVKYGAKGDFLGP